MEKRFREITNELAPTNQTEKEYSEWFTLKRPPQLEATTAFQAFERTVESLIPDLIEFDQSPEEFAMVLSPLELQYVQKCIDLKKIVEDSFLQRFVSGIKRELKQLSEDILNELKKQQELFESNRGAIESMLKSISRDLSQIKGFSPLKLDDLSIMITHLPQRHDGGVVGGKMRGNGTIVLNASVLDSSPKQLPHDLLHEALHFLSTRYTQETDEIPHEKRTGFRYKDKAGLWQFDFFNEAAIERKTMKVAREVNVVVPLGDAYPENRRALEAIIFTLHKSGHENAEEILDQALFGAGNVLALVRVIDKTYADIGGFHQLRELTNIHQEALRSRDDERIRQAEKNIINWCESKIDESQQGDYHRILKQVLDDTVEQSRKTAA